MSLPKDQIESEQEEYQLSSDSESEENSLKQKMAFPLSLEQADQDDIQAFQYLFTVREEASKIKEDQKKLIKNKCRSAINKIQNQSQQKQQIGKFIQSDIQYMQNNKQWFIYWRKQVIKNWKCIIANCKYINQRPQYALAQTKLQQLKVQNSVYINSLSLLTVSDIEQGIKKLSEQYYLSRKNKQNYCLWMYSLLAIHQSRASYKIFSSLADICCCLQSMCSELKTYERNIEEIILVIVMQDYFSQQHLRIGKLPISLQKK